MRNLLILALFVSAPSYSLDKVRLINNNEKLFQKIDLEKLKKNDKRVSSQAIAVIGDGLELDSFKSFIEVNANEVSGDGIDNDSNKYIDDYLGLDLSSKKEIGQRSGSHESNVSSLMYMLSNNENQKHKIKIIPIKITLDEPKFDELYMKKVADGIHYAIDRGARVVNLSLGASKYAKYFYKFIDNDYDKSLQYVQDAINRAKENGVVVLAACSNDNNKDQGIESHYPADLKHVISVTSVNYDHYIKRAYGRSVMTAYYGEDLYVYNTDQDYIYSNGTSLATPMVSMAIAIKLSNNPSLNVDQIRDMVKRASIHRINGRRQIRNGVFDLNRFLELK